MTRVYATAQDYTASPYGDPTVSVSDAALTRASLALDTALIGAWYDTDIDGLPTDPALVEAFKQATIATARYLDETGDSGGTGASGQWQSASIGSASYTRAPTVAQVSAGILPPVAADILKVAGIKIRPIIYG